MADLYEEADKVERLAEELESVGRVVLAKIATSPWTSETGEQLGYAADEYGYLVAAIRAYAKRVRSGDFSPEVAYRS